MYWQDHKSFDNLDFRKVIYVSHVGNEKAHHKIWAIVQTALVPYCQQLFPGKCEVLIWQSCEIQTAMLRKYHARIVHP